MLDDRRGGVPLLGLLLEVEVFGTAGFLTGEVEEGVEPYRLGGDVEEDGDLFLRSGWFIWGVMR